MAIPKSSRLAVRLEPLERVRADRLEHREARLAVRLLLLASRLLSISVAIAAQRSVAADSLGGLERAAAGEHREPGEEALLVGPSRS